MEALSSSLTNVPDQATPDGPSNEAPAARAWWRRHPIAAMLGGRLVAGIVTLFVASILIFAAVNVLPGNAASIVLGRNGTPEQYQQVRASLGLDKALPSRYGSWVGNIVTGDLGDSTIAVARSSPDPSVSGIIGTPLRNSLILAVIAGLLLVPLSLALGAYAAVRAGKAADHVISTTSLVFNSMPEFLIGSLLVVVFFTWLGWLPPISQIPPGASPFAHPNILVLPVLTLLSVSLAFTIRQVRATTIETLRQDYVAMARLNGYRESRVIWRYALRNALPPSVQTIAQTLQYLLGGIIITESVFAYPGIGTTLVQAVSTRDIQLVSVIAFLLAAAYIVINIIADLIVVLLVPKLRTRSS
jgi:peptide/nickel transport system permease protein